MVNGGAKKKENVLTKYIVPRAKEIQKKNPRKKWTTCVKEASAEYRKKQETKKK